MLKQFLIDQLGQAESLEEKIAATEGLAALGISWQEALPHLVINEGDDERLSIARLKAYVAVKFPAEALWVSIKQHLLESKGTRLQVFETCSALGLKNPAFLATLTKAAESDDYDECLAGVAALIRLGKEPKKTEKGLLKLLTDSEWDVRLRAAETIRELRSPLSRSVRNALIKLFKDSYVTVALAAIHTAEVHNEPTLKTGLIAALRTLEGAPFRKTLLALAAMGMSTEERDKALKILGKRRFYGEDLPWFIVAESLWGMNDPFLMQRLLPLMREGNIDVRVIVQAMEALAVTLPMRSPVILSEAKDLGADQRRSFVANATQDDITTLRAERARLAKILEAAIAEDENAEAVSLQDQQGQNNPAHVPASQTLDATTAAQFALAAAA